MKKFFSFRGQTLIELILAMGIAALIFPALLAGFMSSREGRVQQEQRLQAIALLKETEQAVRSVRNNGWSSFPSSGIYHPTVSGSTWQLQQNAATVNGFTQEVTVSGVNRNSAGDIVTSGGTDDPSTRKVVITISWTQPQVSSIVSTIYLTRTTNVVYTETEYNQFFSGTKLDVIVATTSGIQGDGQIQLGAGSGGGDWCSPSFSITTVDLPKSGVANALTAIEGPNSDGSTVFAGTGENASGVSFAKVDIPGNPPTASIPATFDGYKTNAVFGESNYAYLATDSNTKEVIIIDLNQYTDPPINSKYKEVGSINLSGSVNGVSIYVVNNKAYITSSDNKFYIYDIANKTSPALLNSGGLALDGQGKKVLIAGNYAYIATNSTTYPLEIVDISNTSSPSITGRLSLGTGQSGVDVYINTANVTTTRAYLVTSQSVTQKEFYIVNVSNKTSPTISGLSSYDTSGMTPTGLTVVTGNKAIIVGTGGTYQYQVVDISNETGTLSACGNLAYATGIRGVASVLQNSGYAYSYVITGDASSELKIILGGAGGTFTSSGTFESTTYDPGYSVAYNRFSASVVQPSQTSIRMQVGVKNSGSCSNGSYTFVGPNGDSGAYFTPTGGIISGLIPLGAISPNYENPANCFRYKVWLSSSDSTQTPILYDVALNYSP